MGDEEKLKILIEAQNKSQAAFAEAQKQIDDTEKKFSGAMAKMDAAADKMKSVGSKMTKYMTLPIAAGAAVSIKAFSDLQETMSKVEVTFGNSSDAIKKWSDTALQKMGLAQQSALDSAALFGDMGTGMGQTQDEASKMSKGLTQLGADMASFKNVSFDRAQTALAGVYTGETEALKGLGIVMTETNLNAFAVSSGFIKVDKNSTAVREAALKQKEAQEKLNDAMKKHGKSSGEAAKAQIDLEKANAAFDQSMQGTTVNMTQAEKVQLRYNYVMENTKNAQGDFARTSDSIANKQRVATEKAKELSAELGGKLAPVYSKLLEVGTKVLDWFSGLSKGQQDLIVKAALVAAAIGPVVHVMGSLTKGITGTIKAGQKAASITSKLASATVTHGKAIASNVKFYAQYAKMMAKENILKAAAKAKTIALTVAEKARMVATKVATAAQAAFNLVMSANPVFLVVAAIVALVAIMVVLYKKNKAVRDFIDKAWRAIADTFMSVFNTIKGAVLGVFNWLKSNWQLILGIILGPLGLIVLAFTKYKDQTVAVFKAIWEAVKVVWNAIVVVIKWAWNNVIKPIWSLLVAYVKNILIPSWKIIWEVVKTVWNGIVTVVTWAWNNIIKPLWDLIYGYITTILIPTWKLIWDAIKVVWNNIVTVVTWAWDNVIKPIWDVIYAYITTVLIPVWKKIFEAAKTVWDGVWSAVQAAWDFIKPIFEAVWAYITNTLVPIFQKIWDKVKEVFTNVWNKIVSVKDSIVEAFNKVKDTITGLIDKFNTIKEKVSSAFSSVASAITSPFKSAFNSIADLWNKTLGKLSFTIPDWVPGLGGKKFSMPKIDKLYKGARNYRGGPAVVGDIRGNGGEIVNLPSGSDVFNNRESKQILRSLAEGQTMQSTQSGTVIHFHGDIILGDASAVKEFAKQFQRESELSEMGVAV